MKINRRKLQKLYKKHSGKCSICKTFFNRDVVTYTVTGIDSLNRLQVTSVCCCSKLKRRINIGATGYMNESDYVDVMNKHPLSQEFHSKPISPEDNRLTVLRSDESEQET